MQSLSRIVGLGTALVVAALAATPAAAKCTKLGFSVNDYGKDGPTKDAKDLLDKYIAKWATDNKIAKYNVGKKEVSCELFLNFIVFDEHTCRAEATVCFNEPAGGVKLPQDASAAPVSADKPVKKTAKIEPSDKAEKADVAPRIRSRGPVVTRSKAPTETGAVPEAAAAPAAAPIEAAKPVTAPVTASPPSVDKASEAAAAAEKAAAAAERAAAAAERAAAAAKAAPAMPAAPTAVAPAPKIVQ